MMRRMQSAVHRRDDHRPAPRRQHEVCRRDRDHQLRSRMDNTGTMTTIPPHTRLSAHITYGAVRQFPGLPGPRRIAREGPDRTCRETRCRRAIPSPRTRGDMDYFTTCPISSISRSCPIPGAARRRIATRTKDPLHSSSRVSKVSSGFSRSEQWSIVTTSPQSAAATAPTPLRGRFVP